MLIFEKWYQEQYGRSFLYQYDDAELDDLYKAYEDYRQAFSFTMTFKEAFNFLSNHVVFNGTFMSCLNIKVEDDKIVGPYIEFEVNVYAGTEGEFKTAYDPRLDVRSQTFEKGILILAELVKEAYGTSTVEENDELRATPVFNGVVKEVC
ncbi:hypothetical protein ABD91_20805 [Lysinibacillus sphaericus]|uniref:hypothetical protein n=1 Tax=Lysinibacillus sphaericus TaxID=1421 RepID=UPI0018CD2880|nr:hypothetical protein [Lysinibacillus sphaericus]MBG9693183.1 hypothetical protein [Lysinibacillus sphaericus]